MNDLLFHETKHPDLRMLRRATRGGSSVFYAHLTGDTNAIREGQKWGAAAVQNVNEKIQEVLSQRERESGKNKSRQVLRSWGLINASVMLTFYECTCGTSPTAWIHHGFGAETLLAMLGPERCARACSDDVQT